MSGDKFTEIQSARDRISKHLGWDVWHADLVSTGNGVFIRVSTADLTAIADKLDQAAAPMTESVNGGK